MDLPVNTILQIPIWVVIALGSVASALLAVSVRLLTRLTKLATTLDGVVRDVEHLAKFPERLAAAEVQVRDHDREIAGLRERVHRQGNAIALLQVRAGAFDAAAAGGETKDPK